MPKHNIPAYAIVELLIRLSFINSAIGDYKGHTIRAEQVLVKTSGGSINFPKTLVMQQFENPEVITADELINIASLFKPLSKSKNHFI
jgi:hypothetical protein